VARCPRAHSKAPGHRSPRIDQGETVGDLAQPNRSALKAFPLGRSKRKGPARNVLGEYAAPTVVTECELEHGTPREKAPGEPGLQGARERPPLPRTCKPQLRPWHSRKFARG
jgi:hypothetical protein